jgi:alpha-D-ribose 1-methylphosphonate 5-triphosphate synthase subunit PhnH
MGSQAVFRVALAALSSPARRFPADFAGLFAAPPPMPVTVAAMALTLADGLTPVWLSPSLMGASGWLAFHRSAPPAPAPGGAALVIAASPEELPPLLELDRGTDRYPDRSATVLLGGVLEDGCGGLPVKASGPGIREDTVFGDHGLGRGFFDGWALNRSSYPLGVDVFLCGPGFLAGLPRSVSLIPAPGARTVPSGGGGGSGGVPEGI